MRCARQIPLVLFGRKGSIPNLDLRVPGWTQLVLPSRGREPAMIDLPHRFQHRVVKSVAQCRHKSGSAHGQVYY